MRKSAARLAALVVMLMLTGCNTPAVQQDTIPSQVTPEAIQVLEIMTAETKQGAQPVAGPVAAALSKVTPTPSPTPVPTPTPTPAPTPAPTPTPEPTPEFEGFVKIGDGGDRGYVKGHDINIRSGPGTQYKKLGEMDYLTELRIIGKTELWYQVKTDELEGFALKELIGVGRIPEATPTPKATAKPTKTPTPEPEIPSGTAGSYSQEELTVAAKCLYSEGKSQSTDSFLAMANVLLNRVESSRWPNTISENVYRKGQFSMASKNREAFDALVPSEAAFSAVERVFNGGERVLPTGVEFFKAARLGTSWGSHTFYKTIGGNNYFYR